MLTYLPSPYAGETTFSTAAHVHHFNAHTPTESSQLLLRCANGFEYIAVPFSLRQLQRTFPDYIAADEQTVRERSILGAFLPLMPASKRRLIVEASFDSLPDRVQALSGLERFSIHLKILKFCPICAEIQRREQGTTRWGCEDQLPGVWLCAVHRCRLAYVSSHRQGALPRVWALPEHCAGAETLPELDVDAQLLLLKVRSCVAWIASKHSLDTGLLQVMLRWRLKQAGLCRSETKWLTSEQEHLSNLSQQHYARVKVPDVTLLNRTQWLQNAISEHRLYYPLVWAMGLSFAGPTDATSLDRAYEDAASRKPHPDLFRRLWGVMRRPYAPQNLYDAFRQASTLKEAADCAGLELHEVSGWLRKDKRLRDHRVRQTFERTRDSAVAEVRSFMKSHPTARRMHVMRAHLGSYRWLEANDRTTFDQLMPMHTWRGARQLSLNFPSDQETSLARSAVLGQPPSSSSLGSHSDDIDSDRALAV
ncbi:MAG: hypothetical protein EOP24_26010 [Hyphomicrobiales bacterium]|nr:MAG: hypothetical protein EOP24_26010 [Hyphomicrobiales bacterium]